MSDLASLTATEQATLIRTGRASAVDVMEATLSRISSLNNELNAFITVRSDGAMAEARLAQKAVRRGSRLGPLHGVPIAVKDNFETAGILTTAGSRVLEGNVPKEDATVVRRLRDAGAIVVGKTHLSEFAGGPTAFGDMRNPWDLSRMAGVSSGGSTAAVAASICPIGIGTDTGGSIRIPASFSGIVGVKPTYGRVSRWGAFPFNWSFDAVGPLTRTVRDAALTLGVISGYDPRDPTSSKISVPNYMRALSGGVKGLRIGLTREWFFDVVDSEVKSNVLQAVRVLQSLGALTRKVSVPLVTNSLEIGYTIQFAEASAYHQDWVDECPERYTDGSLQNRLLGRLIPATDYIKAQRLRRVLRDQFLKAFEDIDIMITPTTAIAAPLNSEMSYKINGKPEPALYAYALAAFTFPFNQTGMPAVSVPCGFTKKGLPVGMQLIGRPFEDGTVLRVAHTYEQATEWHKARPPLKN